MSKTKQRILQTARVLFNEEGESNIAMIDIAAVLDISPGNLYYHYRGKEQLLPALLECFEQEFGELLNADISPLSSVEDYWSYLYLLLKALDDYRCLHCLDAIDFDKSLSRRYQGLQTLFVKALIRLMEHMQSHYPPDPAFIENDDKLRGANTALLAENISLFTYAWILYKGLKASPAPDPKRQQQFLSQGVYRIFSIIAATFEDRDSFLQDCEKLMV